MPSVVKDDEPAEQNSAFETTTSHQSDTIEITKTCPFKATKNNDEKSAEKSDQTVHQDKGIDFDKILKYFGVMNNYEHAYMRNGIAK